MARTRIPEIHPMLATVASEMPRGDGWVFEPKYDGIRILAVVDKGIVRLLSRNAIDRTANFPEVARAVAALAKESRLGALVLDGELVARTAAGIGRFSDLQQRGKAITEARRADQAAAQAAARRAGGTTKSEGRRVSGTGVTLMVFDLLVAGADVLLGDAWRERHDALARLWRRARFRSVHLQRVVTAADGPRLLARARAEGWEGVIAKQAAGVYESGHRSQAWRKLKLEHSQEFVIGGFTEPRRTREYLGALLLGHYRGRRLVYAGLCGGGFTQDALRRVSAKLRPLEVAGSPFDGPVPRTPEPAHWVKPVLVAQVRFTEWTPDGKLRHPVYLGLRDDKPPVAVHREAESLQKSSPPAPAVRGAKAKRPAPAAGRERGIKPDSERGGESGGLALADQLNAIEHGAGGAGDLAVGDGTTLAVSHLDKVFFPKTRSARAYTKGDLMRYYVQMAPGLLGAIADHPLVLRRFPNGITGPSFYQHRAPDRVPSGVRTADVEAGGNVIRHLIGGDLATVLYAIQLGAISIDPWHSRVGHVATPDYAIIDLDPGETASFARVIDVARWVKEVLDELGLHGIPKTSGMTGIHIMLPLAAGTNEDAARLVAQVVATKVAERYPAGATVTRGVRERGARQVYVDYLQNIRGKTVAGVFAARAHPLAQVSMPLRWEEVTSGLSPAEFTIETAPAELSERRALWVAAMRRGNDLRALVKSSAANSTKSAGPRSRTEQSPAAKSAAVKSAAVKSPAGKSPAAKSRSVKSRSVTSRPVASRASRRST
jgi:bifunctional non-homologous end joining protein LigD